MSFSCFCVVYGKALENTINLAHLFDVSMATVSRIVITWRNFVYLRLGSLNIWPNRETIDRNMPESIKEKIPSTRVIIDCTEIKV